MVDEHSFWEGAGEDVLAAPGIDPVVLRTDRPHSARVYDCVLGGKDHFAPDRAAAEAILRDTPQLATSMRANRRFMHRSVRCLAAEHGIRQFLDVGTGLPTSPNLHEVVQQVDPSCRVLYVDNDPVVLVHARALLTGSREGRTAYLEADLHDPASIAAAPAFAEVLDLSRPAAVSLVAVLHFVTDDARIREVLDALLAPLAPGSALVVSSASSDAFPEITGPGAGSYSSNTGVAVRGHTRAEFTGFFDGFDLVDPGVSLVHRWRPGPEDAGLPEAASFMYGAVGIKR